MTTYLSLISAKQLFKIYLILLTFLIGIFLISCSNRSRIVLTCADVDGWLASTNCSCISKKTSLSFWTSSGDFVCVVDLTCGCPCYIFWSCTIATPPHVTKTTWGSLGSTGIIWIFWLGFRFRFCIKLESTTVLSFHFAISCGHYSTVWSNALQYVQFFIGLWQSQSKFPGFPQL